MIIKRLYINGEPTKYLITDEGQIYSEITEKFLKPFKNPQGYYLIDISHNGKSYTRQLHRLVALTFIPNPNMLETVNHKNGDKSKNCAENLEWMTRLDNVRHAWETGLAKPRFGTDNPANVYSEEQIHCVCKLLESGYKNSKEIEKLTGVNFNTVKDIRQRRSWLTISELYDIPLRTYGNKAYRDMIINLIEKGLTNKQIFEMLDIPESSKRHIEYVRSIYKRSLNDYPRNGSTPIS